MSLGFEGAVNVVSGMPRSGTSLMMRMLEAGGLQPVVDGVRQPDEDNPNGYYEYEPVKRLARDSSWIAETRGKVVKIIYRLLPYLPGGLPYRIVFMERELDEVLASQATMLRRLGTSGGSLDDEGLAKLLGRELEHIHCWLSGQEHMRIHRVRYNALFTAPDDEVGRLADFLGLSNRAQAMKAVIDPRLYRQRQGALHT